MITSRKPGMAVVALLAVLAAGLSACSQPTSPATSGSTGSAPAKMYNIGIAQIVTHPSLDKIRNGFKDCMTQLGFVQGQNVTYDEQNPQGDQVALTAIANNFKSGHKDMIVAITTPVAQAMAQLISTTPIIFAGITDPLSAKLVKSWSAPGGNITGTSDYPPIDQQIGLITQIKPSAKTVGIVYSSGEQNAVDQMQLATTAAQKIGLTVKTAAVANAAEVGQATASLKGVDALYVGSDNTVVSAIAAVIQVADQLQIPLFTSDPDSVAAGGTATYAVNQTVLGCQAATLASEVLKDGKDPGTLPVIKMADLGASPGTDPAKAPLQLTVNVAAAAKQGVTIPDSILATALKVG